MANVEQSITKNRIATYAGYQSDGPACSVAAGTGAGTTPTVTLLAGSNDSRGIISVVTGTSPAASNAVVATVTFALPWFAAPYVSITPCNAAAAALSGATACFADSASTTATQFVLKAGSSALTGATTYLFMYDTQG